MKRPRRLRGIARLGWFSLVAVIVLLIQNLRAVGKHPTAHVYFFLALNGLSLVMVLVSLYYYYMKIKPFWDKHDPE